MRLIVVRHARPVIPTPDGPGEMHRPLTAEGLADAEAIAADLAAFEPKHVASSPYLRAVQTVQPTAELLGLPVQTQWDLREWDSGMGPSPHFARYHARSWADPDLVRPGGESLRQLGVRAVGALRSLLDGAGGGRDVLVGSHGTFLSRALIAFDCPVDWEFTRAMPMPAVYVMDFATPLALPTITGPNLPR